MANSASLLQDLPLDIWERIAFYTVASQESFLGPPVSVQRLSLVSRRIKDLLCVENNSRLYARIFRFKFDDVAPARRLTDRWLTTRCLANEAIRRFSAMRKIRASLPVGEEDLWTVHLMLSENDGKNEAQLCGWARLRQYLAALIAFRTQQSGDSAWGKLVVHDSLLISILWMTTTAASVGSEPPAISQFLQKALHRFIMTAFKYPSFYGPDCYSDLPMCTSVQTVAPHCSGPSLRPCDVHYYGHVIRLSAPPLVPAAVISVLARLERHQTVSIPTHLPRDRATANALGVTGATQEDVEEAYFRTRIHLPPSSPSPVIDTCFMDDIETFPEVEGASRSMIYDIDWSRLVSCHDLWSEPSPLRTSVYKLGSLSGSWAGRYLSAQFETQVNLMSNPDAEVSGPLLPRPLFWELREHHCFLPDEPLSKGRDSAGGDDLLSAWLPRRAMFMPVQDAILVHDPATGKTTRYETHNPGDGSIPPYTGLGYEKYQRFQQFQREWRSGTDTEMSDGSDDHHSWDSAEREPDYEAGSSLPPSTSMDLREDGDTHGHSRVDTSESAIDDDDEWADTVSYCTSGVCDILVTGETSQRHGDAWGHFTIVGRVRAWDGLIVLLRKPTHPLQAHLGQWVFRGYIHDKNLVGRWREISTPVGMLGFEGCFVVSKVPFVNSEA
ncbi:hypothetical protein BDN72DRAFT_814820 [Pluteus cervinus]|uniref:Uncharacterized protein n=1 Tax=Pluteus cervinus TaxID=181527 RepID=A0ACD3B4M0_9AGAR|nr:hypothetical protein BDN72DRAFT_814820 [Pluteus cervinus]